MSIDKPTTSSTCCIVSMTVGRRTIAQYTHSLAAHRAAAEPVVVTILSFTVS
jgi:hypothetical protein